MEGPAKRVFAFQSALKNRAIRAAAKAAAEAAANPGGEDIPWAGTDTDAAPGTADTDRADKAMGSAAPKR